MLEKWGLTRLKVRAPMMEMEWSPSDPDKDAAWDLYVELLTRVATQPLAGDHGLEKKALESVYELFGVTREVLKIHGRSCGEFARISVIVLNQIIRPFTAKWHKKSQDGDFESPEECTLFRKELECLQLDLKNYTKLLADMANVEDLSYLTGDFEPEE